MLETNPTVPATAGSLAPPEIISFNAVAIRPFRVEVSEEALTDLRRRIKATRFPEKETAGSRHKVVTGVGSLRT
jgi:hypothetical protein